MHDTVTQAPTTFYKAPAKALCPMMKQDIEQSLKITYTDLFEWAEDKTGKIMPFVSPS
jgi:hypothetical protein